ncbi:ribitol-5-phosphate xylosyltransferase 1-like [Neocloeon triangulifer]|uniref:ribitol-5-phosphate xylosyltransferase 1-like n=1 Tax=Neocloeon triangulifer TaxID=2078957 RepID=UPI00286F6772|nr:ribitol-5-phosphate xylosyltransferase 1-like [Neocloeon triangulifer]
MRALCTCRRLVIVLSALYLLCIVIATQKLYRLSNSNNIVAHVSRRNGPFLVEIWSKASIGDYLWGHILNGPSPTPNGPLMNSAQLTYKDINFSFKSGPGLVPASAPKNVTHLVIILNGRSEDKIEQARVWLDSMPAYEDLRTLAVILLGDEKCNNEWILPYLKKNGGSIDFVFVTYDSPLVDGESFYQWPLGVSVYRGFPNINPASLDLTYPREFTCNFLGTVYANSSRERLSKIINSSSRLQKECFMSGRDKWQPLESEQSRQLYLDTLLQSDLTLSPVGFNTECYRIYEALSLGSIPVVEDIMTPGGCDASSAASPLRLLKKMNAPMLYLKDWSQLEEVLESETLLSKEEKINRRKGAVRWYEEFKHSIKKIFVNVLRERWFDMRAD